MDFLRACARRLDQGEEAETVLEDMRARYTTVRCLSVKTCLVRQMCSSSPEYEAAKAALLAEHDLPLARRLQDALRTGRRADADLLPLLATLPPRLPANARRLAITRGEARACKRESARRAVEKNSTRARVEGRALLACAREVLRAAVREGEEEEGGEEKGGEDDTTHSAIPFALLALSLMLLTGRRACEVLNGRSVVLPEAEHAIRFRGLAKKKRSSRRGEEEHLRWKGAEEEGEEERDGKQREDEQREDEDGEDRDDEEDETRDEEVDILLPTLAPARDVAAGFGLLRARQGNVLLTNREASRRYQSLLGRTLSSHHPWKTAPRPHALRGVYACMCLRLFDWSGWGDPSDAYVAMCILGHAGLHESLVYTPYDLGEEFGKEEDKLGKGLLTPWS